MTRRLLTAAVALSIVVFVFCEYTAMAYFHFYRNGVIDPSTDQVVHLSSDLDGAKRWAAWGLLGLVLPIARFAIYAWRAARCPPGLRG